MRVFLLAVFAAFGIAGIASLALDRAQQGSDAAYTSNASVRVDLSKDGIEARSRSIQK